MTDRARCVKQRRVEIFTLQIGEIRQDLGLAHLLAQQIQQVADSDPHTPNTGPATALQRIDRNTLKNVHVFSVTVRRAAGFLALEEVSLR